MAKQKTNHTLAKIVAVLLLLCVVVGAGVYYAPRLLPVAKPLIASAPASEDEALKKAQDLVAQGKLDEARALLKPLTGTQALLLSAQLDEQAGQPQEAVKRLEQAYRTSGASPDHPVVATAYARALDLAGNAAEAARIYGEIVQSAPPELRAPALAGLGCMDEKAGDLIKARDKLRQAVNEAKWDSREWNEAVDALGRVNVALIFSSKETPESKWYEVQRGDSVTSIGNNLKTTQGLLTRANGIDENTRLSLGRRLKYTPKDFRIVVERSKTRIFLVDKDGIFKRYQTGLGKPGHETTPGSYHIGNKEKNPIWHKPGEGPVPSLDPKNELGTRWMPLIPEQQGLPRDLGIHGTIHPESVPGFVSNGCARMLPPDVEELYDLVVRATPVDIVETVTAEQLLHPATMPPAAVPAPPEVTAAPDAPQADQPTKPTPAAKAAPRKAQSAKAPSGKAPSGKAQPSKAQPGKRQ